MDESFWLERWRRGEIGFHRDDPNPRLVSSWSKVTTDHSSRVLVPLCGKSVDLAYLASLGHEVVGVELAESAATAFFEERGAEPRVETVGPFRCHASGRVRIFVGNFFDATPDRLGGLFDAAYDRAALVALPPELRERYVATLRALLRPAAPILLVTLAFDAPSGPPFSIDEGEVRALYDGARVDLVESVDVTDESRNMLARGATHVTELAFHVRGRGSSR